MVFSARTLAKVLGVALVASGPVVAAGAAEEPAGPAPLSAGWWHRGPVDNPLVADAPRPPLVPVQEGSTYVANDMSGARAMAAYRFAADTAAGTVTLAIAEGAVMPAGARLLACAVRSPWRPVANGAWDDRPTVDCTTAVEAG